MDPKSAAIKNAMAKRRYNTVKLWFYKLPAAGVRISTGKLKDQMFKKAKSSRI